MTAFLYENSQLLAQNVKSLLERLAKKEQVQ